MAEMDTSSGGGHKKGPGVKKGKKLSTRIDLTPMVDLGFLLITFFMFTTTLAKPKGMTINMPFDKDLQEKDKTKVKKDAALTVLLGKEHRIYYYEGIGDDPLNPPKMEVTYFNGKNNIRDVLIKKKATVESLKQAGGTLNATDQLVVLIKPDSTSTYDDYVNIMDEMTINAVPVPVTMKIADQDREFIRLTEGGAPATPAATP